MIRSFRNAASRKLFTGSPSNRFAGVDLERAAVLLDALNVATSPADLSPLASVGVHRLKGDRKGQWAMTINGRWRICFRFEKGDAYDVEVVDYHRG